MGADNAGFVQQLLEVEGLEGAAVTNPASVGGAGVTLALQILGGEEPEETRQLVDPGLGEQHRGGNGLARGGKRPGHRRDLAAAVTIDGWTTYTKDDILACEEP